MRAGTPPVASTGPRNRRAAALVTLLWAWAGIAIPTPAPLAGQDLEVASRRAGIPLPEGYWLRKAADPLAFELPNGLFGARAALPPTSAPERVTQPRGAPYRGVARLPVILGLFADSPEPWLSATDISTSLFQGPAPGGTLTEYYSEASYGQFTVEGDVQPWLRSSLTRGEVVGNEYGLGGDSRVGDYLVELLDSADARVNFARYDNDGPDGVPNSGDDDGIVDAVAFEFLEVSASCGGAAARIIRWPAMTGAAGDVPPRSGHQRLDRGGALGERRSGRGRNAGDGGRLHHPGRHRLQRHPGPERCHHGP